MAQKFEQVDPSYFGDRKNSADSLVKPDTALARSAADSAMIAREHMHNVIAMTIKHYLFETIAPGNADVAPMTVEKPKEETVKKEDTTSGMSSVQDIVNLARGIENQQLKKTA